MGRFDLGSLVATPGALQVLQDAGRSPIEFIARHSTGDWGSCCKEDAKANEDAIRHGARIISIYHVEDKEGEKTKLYVITSATDDQGRRESTTILLSSEY